MFYKGFSKTQDFSNSKTIHSFGDAIKNGIITMYMTNNEQSQSEIVLAILD